MATDDCRKTIGADQREVRPPVVLVFVLIVIVEAGEDVRGHDAVLLGEATEEGRTEDVAVEELAGGGAAKQSADVRARDDPV
jgi:hypothetical protein